MNEFKLKKVVVQKQFNGKFGFKLVCGFLPIISVVVFFVAQACDLFHNPSYGQQTLGNDLTKYQDPEFYLAGTTGQKGAYLFCRNILMITTLGNLFNAAGFINSAINNKYEGQGKFDNRVGGIMCINTIIYIVLFYNLSLIVSHDILNHMHGYNGMSGMLEHMGPDLFMIVYFFVFYRKTNVMVSKKASARSEGGYEMLIGVSFVFICNVFFLILGYSLRAARGTRVFGEMSYTGYFPYPFYNFLPENKQAVGRGEGTIKPGVEFVGVMLVQSIEQVAIFSLIHGITMKQIKNNNSFIN